MTKHLPPSTPRPRLLLLGAEAPFGAEIQRRMHGAGFDVMPVPPGAVARSRETATGLDVLVVNVPVVRSTLRFDAVDDQAFESALQSQLFDVVQAAQAALPCMRSGARMVFVGSRGHLGAWGGAHLMAASAALVAMTRCMALELAHEGIRVNLIAADFAQERGDTPALRAAVAHAVEFLSAAELGISGETLLVDGNAGLRMGESRNLGAQPGHLDTINPHPSAPAGPPST